MAGFLDELKSLYQVQLERHRNRPFLRGVMAAGALVTTIHGEVTLGQRMRLDKVLETLGELKVFDPHEGVNLFDEYVQGIFADPPKGQARALREVKEVAADDAERAELLIRICLAISEADGGIDLAEQIEIVPVQHPRGGPRPPRPLHRRPRGRRHRPHQSGGGCSGGRRQRARIQLRARITVEFLTRRFSS